MQIGIVGGMGSIATADFFMKLVRAFPADKEWDRPRVIIDNNCIMPSRVRAILYGEKRGELCRALASSIAGLVNAGCTDIVLCCNTSHVFEPEFAPLAAEMTGGKPFKLRHILRALGRSLKADGVTDISLIATEGTILSGIYPSVLGEYGITVRVPDEGAFAEMRYLIECVKRDAIDKEALERYAALLVRWRTPDVALGCTEFPVLQSALGETPRSVKVHDPLKAVTAELRRDFEAEKI